MSYKVLMTLMGMEIGGAETHVLELCKALRAKGLEVMVASNGGVYEKELAEYNIKHFKVPLHNKKISNLIKSYYALKKIIIENEIKLVHAHARIPAFLCGLLKKELDFKFVTTAHWIFKTIFPFNILTNWGERTLSVSEDIKKYLIDNYGLPHKNISITINGIDTSKFSSGIDTSDIIKNLGLDPNKKKIVCVSRLDSGRSLAPKKLIEITEEIHLLFPKIEIIIVGGGNDFDELSKLSTDVNKKLGEQVIYLPGPRTDINKFLALGDIFVGVSRAALEAMSAEKPVILAGNEGYIGIFDEKKLSQGIETNFCCRGCEEVTNEKLKTDIIKLLNFSDSALSNLGTYGKKVVEKYYSIDNMANDAIKMYEEVRYLKRDVDVMISGYYGFNNNGDDSVLKSIVDDLRFNKPDIKILVLSRRPKETSAIYKVDSINRFNFFEINRWLKKTNLLISGGGSLIQDLTSTHSLLYYLWVMTNAKRHGVKVMLYANGIGPIQNKWNRHRVKKVLNKSDMITLRDKASLIELDALKVDKPPILITADAAFNLKNTNPDESKNMLSNLNLHDKKYFVVAVRSWKYNAENFEETIAKFADYIYDKYKIFSLFVPMHPSNDAEISKKIISIMKSPGIYLGTNYNTNHLLGVVSNAEFVLGMRLHTIIYAIQTHRPILGLVYDPKVKSIMDDINQFTYLDVKTLEFKKLKRFADEILNNREKISYDIEKAANQFQISSTENTKIAIQFINEPNF